MSSFGLFSVLLTLRDTLAVVSKEFVDVTESLYAPYPGNPNSNGKSATSKAPTVIFTVFVSLSGISLYVGELFLVISLSSVAAPFPFGEPQVFTCTLVSPFLIVI